MISLFNLSLETKLLADCNFAFIFADFLDQPNPDFAYGCTYGLLVNSCFVKISRF